jgi:hypothetical protein
MATTQEYLDLLNQIAALRSTLADQLAGQLVENPQLADVVVNQLDDLLASAVDQDQTGPQPPDLGLANLVGIGDEAAAQFGDTRLPFGIMPYDDTVTPERLLAVGDLYYIFQFEMVGLFRAILRLQELFKAGTVRLSDGQGAFNLYRYDRRQVLRHTARDRMQAYRRVFGYTVTDPPTGAIPNYDFHKLFVQFMTQVARYYRDKRISEVIRPNSDRYTFGSVAVVRRAGLDLRNNLKQASYGHVNVLRVEVMQLLDEAFRILGEEDIRRLFGADTAWDVIEDIARLYMNKPAVNLSQRSRMGTAGRNVIHWLAQPHILNATRAEFEALLTDIADEAEEWLTSAEALGMTRFARGVAPGDEGRGRNGRREREDEWMAVR